MAEVYKLRAIGIMRLFLETFLRPQPVLEEVCLPGKSPALRGETFPRAHRRSKTRICGKQNEQMHMIRHQNKKPQMPTTDFMIRDRGFDYLASAIQQHSFPALTRANGQKINFPVGNP